MSSNDNLFAEDDSRFRFRQTLGQVLRDHRYALHLDDEHAASIAGIDPSTLNRLERGVNDATLAVVARVGATVRVKPDDIIAALTGISGNFGSSNSSHSLTAAALSSVVMLDDVDAFARFAQADAHMADLWLITALDAIVARFSRNTPNNNRSTKMGLSSMPLLDASMVYRVGILYPDLAHEDVLTLYRAGGVITPEDIFAYLRGLDRDLRTRRRARPRAMIRLIENRRLDSLKFIDAVHASVEWSEETGDPSTFLAMCWSATLYQAAYGLRPNDDPWDTLLPTADDANSIEGRRRYAGRLFVGVARWLDKLGLNPGGRPWIEEVRDLTGPRP